MFRIERKLNNLVKFKTVKSLTIFAVLYFIINSGILFSQTFKDVKFPDGLVAGLENRVNFHIDYKIYQTSPNIIKFDLPDVSYVKIGIYDSNNNLVRTYIYNNLLAGTYEIKINPSNLGKGNYTCVLACANVQESSQVVIE